jgi:tRNA wybutosine-synthesizing protein 3
MQSSTFADRKSKILSQLAIPDQEYTDLSPKGSVDEGIRELVDEINVLDGFVTTSSCAGRVAVFLDGASKKSDTTGTSVDDGGVPSSAAVAVQGGKGGGQWLYVSHDPIDESSLQKDGDLVALFGMNSDDTVSVPVSEARLVHFRFEPMVSPPTVPPAPHFLLFIYLVILSLFSNHHR